MDDDKSIKEIEKALEKSSNFKINNVEEFDRCINHIIQLISDSYSLYRGKSFASSIFFSITIIEEVAKIHMGVYIKKEENLKRREDSLRSHKKKQIIASNKLIEWNKILKDEIGESDLNEIFQKVYNGKMLGLREKALYCDYELDKLLIPNESFDKKTAKNYLLFAIEAFDDNLVGYTRYSLEKSKFVGKIFEEIVNEEE